MATVPFDINSLPSNSKMSKDISKNDREKIDPVVKKEDVIVGKKSLGRKLKETFISEDSKDVKSYVFLDVIVPTIKNTILDILEMVFFGGTTRRGYSRSYADRVSYSSYYKSEYNGRRSTLNRDSDRSLRRSDDKIDYRNIILKNRRDAEEVVNELIRRIDEYKQATIADLFDLIDVTSSYVDNNWGWTDPRDIGIRRVSAGYLIDVSEARYLD